MITPWRRTPVTSLPGGPPGTQKEYRNAQLAALLAKAETAARDLLTGHREAPDRLTAALLEQETVSGDQVRALAQTPNPTRS